jgi:hypothetical protein
MRFAQLAAILVSTLFGLASTAVAETPSSRSDLPSPADTLPVAIPVPTAAVVDAPDLGSMRRPDLDERRAALAQPAARAPVPTPKPKAEIKGPTGKVRARGDATWYCLDDRSPCHYAHSGGLYAAAGPALRVGDWRGRRVWVCAGGDCVRVKLIDWCACGNGRVIDLYSDAFRRLASLGTGEIRVSVRW